jgi:hypothetical protein
MSMSNKEAKMEKELLPKDVKAYLIQAAAQVAKEQGFCPESQEASDTWFRANAVAIGDRARDLQIELLNKLTAESGYYRGTRDRVCRILAAKIWEEVNVREVRRRAGQEYAHALRAA